MLFLILMRIVDGMIDAYITILFIRMILDWIAVLSPRWYPRGVVAKLINIVYTVTEPPLRWLRRYIPPLRLGAVALDMSFIVLYFILVVLRAVIRLPRIRDVRSAKARVGHPINAGELRECWGYVLMSYVDTNVSEAQPQSEV